jgi:hypothetical protein
VHAGPALNQSRFGYLLVTLHLVYTFVTDIDVAIFKHSMLSALYILGKTERFYCVTPYLMEKLSNLRSFDRH